MIISDSMEKLTEMKIQKLIPIDNLRSMKQQIHYSLIQSALLLLCSWKKTFKRYIISKSVPKLQKSVIEG